MKIRLNGETSEIENTISIAELLKINKVERPEMVSVQLNETYVDKESYNSTYVNENDEIDFLYFMGGGELLLTSGLVLVRE